MDILIQKVKEFAALSHLPDDEDINFDSDHTDTLSVEDQARIEEISNLACDFLITNDGRCNFENHRALEAAIAGVLVLPGETDSFGWLTGVIHTRKGQIVYG